MIKPLNNFRNFLQGIGVTNWQYLLLAVFSSTILAVLWFYLEIISGNKLGFLVVIFGLNNGILAYLFMEEKGQSNKVFFSLLLSTFSLMLGKYLVFEHLYDWYLSAYIDKSEVSINLIAFYFSSFNMESLKLFIDQINTVFSFVDIIWIIIMLILSIQYTVLDFRKNRKEEDEEIRHKFRKRRFE